MGLKIARDTDTVPLYNRADMKRIAELGDAIEEATIVVGPKRVADADPVLEAVAEYDEFKAAATERATKVEITALPTSEWRKLLAEHPPRRDVIEDEEVVESFPQDHAQGFNIESIADPLVKASLTPDQFDDRAELEQFVEDLSDPHFSLIFSAAVKLNTEAGPDPKFSASSWLARTSAVMSRSDESSGSDSQGSSDSPQRIASSSEQSG